MKELRKQPAVKNMAKGFEWVKANMEEDDLGAIKTYLELDEQLKFRCPKKRKSVVKPKTKTVKGKTVDKQKLVKSKQSEKGSPKSKETTKKVKKKKPVRTKKKKAKKKPVKKTSNVETGNFLEEFFNSVQLSAPEKK